MTRDQLIEVGERLFGRRWQTPLAESLGVAVRTVQRMVKTGQISDSLARRIAALDQHDAWIIGEGAADDLDYIVHTKHPRFVARFAPPDEPPDDTFDGLNFSLSDGSKFLAIIWIDTPPSDEADLLDLVEDAERALELWEMRS